MNLYANTLNIFHLNHWQINETKEKIVMHSKVLGRENEMAESSFLYFAKALQF